MILVPLLLIAVGGLFYNFTYPDFCLVGTHDVCANVANWVNGQPTIWAGCVTTCGFSVFNVFGSSILSNFVLAAGTGDYLALLGAFLTTVTSLPGLLGMVALAMSAVFIVLGSGLSFSGEVVATGFSVGANEAGTRFYQSIGITLLVFSIVYFAFGGWMLNMFGTGFGLVGGLGLFTLLVTMVFYGAYHQGKTEH